MRLGHLTQPHYANILLLSNEGERLATIGRKRANWYVAKNLAIDLPPIEGYARVLKLNFVPKSNEGSAFSLQVKQNICVVCGSDKELTLHHVIPYCVKKHFPYNEKEHSSQWCVLCCENCHIQAEEFSRQCYESVLKAFSKAYSQCPMHVTNHIIEKLYKLKVRNKHTRVPPEVIQEWLALSSVFKSLDEVPTERAELKKYFQDTKIVRIQLRQQLMSEYIQANGGVEGIKMIYRDAFLRLEPKFLPKGFLEL